MTLRPGTEGVHIQPAASPSRVPMVSPHGLTRPSDEYVLVGEGVSKRFGKRVIALEKVSITLRPGEVVSLLGRSGSGKSTLLLCLAGVLAPDDGLVLYLGRALGTMSDTELARLRRTEFGFVFQFGHLLAELTGLDNVALPLRLNNASRDQAKEVALAQLAVLGISELADKRPAEMSGGEVQRVAVARALVTKPRVIFADEPTGNLDSRTGELVVELLVEAARGRGASVLLVTHDHHVASFGDQSVFLRDGRIVQAGEA